MYLIGSIFFIPATDMIVAGETFFIYGSLVIFLSQTWKVIRTARFDYKNKDDTSFKLSNLKEDALGFWVDFFAGTGGFFYMIGTIFFK
jgi:hypothetical protein